MDGGARLGARSRVPLIDRQIRLRVLVGVAPPPGSQWEGVGKAVHLMAPNGTLAIAIYNDQGVWSKRWTAIKRFYCSGTFGKVVLCSTYIPARVARELAADLFWLRNPLRRYTQYGTERGMSVFYDML